MVTIGDEVLKEFANRVTHALREQDMLVRWGGEEFLVVAKVYDEDDFHNIAQRIHKAVTQKPFILPNGLELPVTCTVGGVICPYLTDIDQVPHWRTWCNWLIQLCIMASHKVVIGGFALTKYPRKRWKKRCLTKDSKALISTRVWNWKHQTTSNSLIV